MHSALRFTGPDEHIVEGLLCPFDIRDSYNTQFRRYTQFHLDLFPEGSRPLCWHHCLDRETGADPIGRVSQLEITPQGLVMRAILDKTSRWFAKVRDAIKRGAVGLSSGSLAHLVSIDERTGDILNWPVVEASLTPTPSCPAATVTRHTLRTDAARAHFRALGLPFVEPGLCPVPYEGSALQSEVRREMARFQAAVDEAERQERRREAQRIAALPAGERAVALRRYLGVDMEQVP